MANFCDSHCPLKMSMVEACSQREMIDKAFLVHKCVRLWYPEKSNLCLIWDIGEIWSERLPGHQQKVTLFVVGPKQALRWFKENVMKYRKLEAPTVDAIHGIKYSSRLELFESACKLFAVLMEVKRVWSRIRFFSWFMATLTSWPYVLTKNHMKIHQKEYHQLLAEIEGSETFKRPLRTHRIGITTG